jgi:hypothetical protein
MADDSLPYPEDPEPEASHDAAILEAWLSWRGGRAARRRGQPGAQQEGEGHDRARAGEAAAVTRARGAGLGLIAVLLAGCASLAVPRGPVWGFDVSNSASDAQVVYTMDERDCYVSRMEMMSKITGLQAAGHPKVAGQPIAFGACRPVQIADAHGSATVSVYWALRLHADGGLALTTQAACRAAARANHLSESACIPVAILPMEPPPAETTK